MPTAKKTCPDCKETKPVSEFHRRQDKRSAPGEQPTYLLGKTFSKCKICRNKDTQARQRGITRAQLDNLGERCDACGNNRRRLCIDHDHRTQEVRGILCHNCNVVLGLVDDDIPTLEALIKYLQGIREVSGAQR